MLTGRSAQVVERLEAVLQLQRFTQLGGLQLERDVRMLTGALGEVTQRTVRDKFSRLAQMATLLSVEARPLHLDCAVSRGCNARKQPASAGGTRAGREASTLYAIHSCARPRRPRCCCWGRPLASAHPRRPARRA